MRSLAGMQGCDGKMGRGGRVPTFISLLVAVTLLGTSVALAQSTAQVHMSVSPGGAEVTTIGSDTAVVYAVLAYQDLPISELKVSIFGRGGVIIFEHADTYGDSGQVDIEITGRAVFAGYMSAAQEQGADAQEAVALAQQSAASYAKRSRVGTVIAAARTLEMVLEALKDYSLPSEAWDRLNDAQQLADDVETKGFAIANGEVSDDDLDAALEELASLVTEMADAVDAALADVDTGRERPWPDGAYTTTLKQDGQIKDGFDWEIGPDGTAGTPVSGAPTSTSTPEPTATPTPSDTPQPTATPTSTSTLPAGTTPSPTETPTFTPAFTPTFTATSTAQPAATSQDTTPIETVAQATSTPGSTPASATDTPAPRSPSPTQVSEEPSGPASARTPNTPSSSTEELDETEAPPGTATPIAQSLVHKETDSKETDSKETDSEEVETAQEASAAALEVPRDVPLAPQDVGASPLGEWPPMRIMAVLGAVMLGIIALWLRAKV